MAYLEELLPEFRKGAKIRLKDWKKGRYICFKDGIVIDEKYNYFSLIDCLLSSDSWELYQEPKLDWDYIIKNKCICWFWDEKEEEKRVAGILIGCDFQHGDVFYLTNNIYYDHCRPVRRDEVTFYEDKKDEVQSVEEN